MLGVPSDPGTSRNLPVNGEITEDIRRNTSAEGASQPCAPPGKEQRPGLATEALSEDAHGGGTSLPSSVSRQGDVPGLTREQCAEWEAWVHFSYDRAARVRRRVHGRDFEAELRKCTGPDDPRFKALEIIADAWQPALAAAQNLGYRSGYAAGCWDTESEAAEQWRRMLGPIQATLRQPTYAELARRRAGGQ